MGHPLDRRVGGLQQVGGPGTAADWSNYYGGWVAWNTVRTLTGLASAVALVAGVLRRG